MRVLPRMLLALGAAAVAAWFGLGWIQARDTGRAQAIVSAPRLGVGQARTVSSLLSSASVLNPDRTVDILRAQLASARHHYRRAVTILESVTREEPLNYQGWEALTIAAGRAGRTKLAERAYAHLGTLVREPK